MVSNNPFDVSMSATAAGYAGAHGSTPSQLPQLMEATTNCVNNFCRVQTGENVLVVAEFDSDPLVVASLVTAANMAGAEVAAITVKPFSTGGYRTGAPGDMLFGAYEKADVIITCTFFAFGHSDRTFINDIFKTDKRVCELSMAASPGALVTSGRFSIDLFLEIAKRADRFLKGCKTVRYVTASGTDIVFEDPQGIVYNQPLMPGSWGIFPPNGINFYPRAANGILVPDETSLHGRPSGPIKFTVSGGYVTDVQAAAQSDVATVEAFANGKYYLRHTLIGLNPKARTVNAPQFERERAAGTTYLGLDGTEDSAVADLSKPGHAHLDMIFDTPTVYVDDKLMVERRRLLILEDEELLKLAGNYGEPRRILAQNPFLW